MTAGFALRNVPATSPMKLWPYLLFAYAFVGTVLPWVIPGGEFHPRASVVLGIICALPFWLAAHWLAQTPYHAIMIGCWVMVGLWGLHFLLSLLLRRPD